MSKRPDVIQDGDDPVSMFVGDIDLMNLPGKKRLQLVRAGKLDADRFVTPANLPGKKLQALREEQRERIEGQLDEEMAANKGGKNDNPYSVGDIVNYLDFNYEVLEVNELKVKIEKEDGKKVWVPFLKVKKG